MKIIVKNLQGTYCNTLHKVIPENSAINAEELCQELNDKSKYGIVYEVVDSSDFE